MRRIALLIAAVVVLPGCFWGSSEANVFFTVSGGNYGEFEDLLYPGERAEAWESIFEARPSVEVGGSFERSDLMELFLPYETDRTRAVVTQKGDLQITSHLKVGAAYDVLAEDGFGDLGYLENEGEIYGRLGDGCGSEIAADERSGVGRCVVGELSDNAAAYGKLDEDLRVILLVNLPGEDDIRSTTCQDRPREFESADWAYPRTLRVNYNAYEPTEAAPDRYADGEEDEHKPLAQCDIEVFATVQLGFEEFSGEWYGQNAEDPDDFTLDRTCEECDEPILGTVELSDLVLPGEDGEAVAKGRYRIAFASDTFAALDGRIQVIGSFDSQIRRDPEELEEPSRQLDLGSEDDDI